MLLADCVGLVDWIVTLLLTVSPLSAPVIALIILPMFIPPPDAADAPLVLFMLTPPLGTFNWLVRWAGITVPELGAFHDPQAGALIMLKAPLAERNASLPNSLTV